jgi:serine/threonine protein kinase
LADRPTLPRPGDVIAGKYRIDCALGTGGMGAVYQATHRVTGKRFALKWLLPQMTAHGDAAQRFIREAQVAGRFEHPNVVEVYDVGAEGDSFYMVMELLEGESLAERVDRAGPLSVIEACELLIPCMRGVAEAHGAGIVHRDLKPANIFVCRADRHGGECAKVLDFGISKMSGGPSGELGEGMTKSGTLIGTPHYMPLEQMRGREVDHRADIYAFGVVLYQVLSGNLPYPADSFSDLVLMLAHETPAPLDRIVARLPRGVAQVVARAMARDAADRYQSIDALVAALEPYATGDDSVPAYTPSSRRSLDSSLSMPTPLSTESRASGRVSSYVAPSRNRGPWIVGISAFVILVAIAAGAFWLRRERGQAEVAGPGVVRPGVAAPNPPAKPAASAAASRPPAQDEALPALNIEPKPLNERVAAPGSVVAVPAEPRVERGVAQPTSNAQTERGVSAARGTARVHASTPAALRGGAAARVTDSRTQAQRAAPPAPERAEPPASKPGSAKDPWETTGKPPSNRVPAISEGDFY